MKRERADYSGPRAVWEFAASGYERSLADASGYQRFSSLTRRATMSSPGPRAVGATITLS
jgi:hypothetical protein